MTSVKQFFNKNDRLLFNNCCQYFELALSYFGYNSKTQCYLNNKNQIILFVVNINYKSRIHQFFRTLNLKEFCKKMELLNYIYVLSKDNHLDLESGLHYVIKEQKKQFIIIQEEISNLLNWKDFIDNEINCIESYRYNSSQNVNRTLH